MPDAYTPFGVPPSWVIARLMLINVEFGCIGGQWGVLYDRSGVLYCLRFYNALSGLYDGLVGVLGIVREPRYI